jgi:hypothetical protein
MTELSECGTIKLLAIVHCDFFGHTEAVYNVLPEKLLQGCSCDITKHLGSIHFEKYSTATAAYLKLPRAVGRGPTTSMPHRTRGQTGGIRWTSSVENLL